MNKNYYLAIQIEAKYLNYSEFKSIREFDRERNETNEKKNKITT